MTTNYDNFAGFSGENVSCPKCGSKDIRVAYHRDNLCNCCGDVCTRTLCDYAEKEHLQRRCAKCEYCWPEACLSPLEQLVADAQELKMGYEKTDPVKSTKPPIYANTISKRHTHFLAAVPLIQQARTDFNIASENWPYPTGYVIGRATDDYFAEVWTDGMDWQNNYWVIERSKCEDPVALPFLYFKDHSEELKFNHYYFGEMIEAALHLRRDNLWIKEGENNYHNDTVWAFVSFCRTADGAVIDKEKGDAYLILCNMQHNSQPYVEFYINADFLPKKLNNFNE